MAGKKRVKPIRISLTEEQIAEVIRNTVKSRKGFNVESLEDRIAPSRIGLPIGGGAEDLVGDPMEPMDPHVGDHPGEGGFDGGADGSLGGDGGGVDGGLGGGDDGGLGGEPPLPGGEPPLPGGEPPLPGDEPFIGGGPGGHLGDPMPGEAGYNAFQAGNDFSHGPIGGGEFTGGGDGGEIPNRFGENRPGLQEDPRLAHEAGPDVDPEADVSPEELQQHRQAILRQLRGGQG